VNEKSGPQAASQCPAKVTTTKSTTAARQWTQVCSRRAASRELDTLLGIVHRPNVHELYPRPVLREAS